MVHPIFATMRRLWWLTLALTGCATPDTPLADFASLTAEVSQLEADGDGGTIHFRLLGNALKPCLKVDFELPATVSGVPMRQRDVGGQHSTKGGFSDACRHVEYELDHHPPGQDLEVVVDDGSKAVRVVFENGRGLARPMLLGLDGGAAEGDVVFLQDRESRPVVGRQMRFSEPGQQFSSRFSHTEQDGGVAINLPSFDGGARVAVRTDTAFRLTVKSCEGATCDAGFSQRFMQEFDVVR